MLPGSTIHRAGEDTHLLSQEDPLRIPGKGEQRSISLGILARSSKKCLFQLVLVFFTYFLTHAYEQIHTCTHPYTRLLLTDSVVNLSV